MSTVFIIGKPVGTEEYIDSRKQQLMDLRWEGVPSGDPSYLEREYTNKPKGMETSIAAHIAPSPRYIGNKDNKVACIETRITTVNQPNLC